MQTDTTPLLYVVNETSEQKRKMDSKAASADFTKMSQNIQTINKMIESMKQFTMPAGAIIKRAGDTVELEEDISMAPDIIRSLRDWALQAHEKEQTCKHCIFP